MLNFTEQDWKLQHIQSGLNVFFSDGACGFCQNFGVDTKHAKFSSKKHSTAEDTLPHRASCKLRAPPKNKCCWWADTLSEAVLAVRSWVQNWIYCLLVYKKKVHTSTYCTAMCCLARAFWSHLQLLCAHWCNLHCNYNCFSVTAYILYSPPPPSCLVRTKYYWRLIGGLSADILPSLICKLRHIDASASLRMCDGLAYRNSFLFSEPPTKYI